MQAQEQFSSRWGLLVAAIGMAVGTGNIWRFPRVAAQNGGGEFLIPWIVFLLLWSIPLLMVETAMGRHTRRGTVGAFARLMGPNYAWLGAFVGFCSMAITFYYSVVAGWCFKYLSGALGGTLLTTSGDVYWADFQASGWESVVFHLIAISVAGAIVHRGVINGIERASKVLIPLLFVLLLAGTVRAITLPGATDGLNFLFNPDLGKLLDYRIWLEGLTQSAWSTGAGYGLLLSYAVYTAKRDDIVMNSLTIGFGNNSASLLAGIMVICSVFALAPADPGAPPAEELLQLGGPGNTALSFLWIPALFQQMPFGQLSLILFFMALVVAAISSLIAMIELGVRIFMDAGMTRSSAVKFVVGGSFLLGVPSALRIEFLMNQDSVWGIGLMVSGFLFAVAVNKFGVRRFREELIEPARNDIPVGKWFDILLKWVIPAEFVVLILWWLYQATISDPAWWNPVAIFNLGTCLFQWGVAFVLFRIFNDRMANATLGDTEA
ncbi:MAG: sodium-dependent transporter [Acidobacteria bacterium]|nr:sodium-dependent transporter [Acidobacteriota bacterium]